MFLGEVIDKERLGIREEANALECAGFVVKQKHIDFFCNEMMKEGCSVYYYGTYQEDGDFGQFSKIIAKFDYTPEQRQMFEDDDDEIAFYENIQDLLKANDPELISVDFDIVKN